MGHKLLPLCIKKDILSTLAYFDMFSYPLRKREIFTFLRHREALLTFEKAMESLVSESAIYHLGEFYSLHNNPALVERRRRGNRKAAVMLQQAEKAALIISAFPFVKGVAVSGSLSKNFADEKADIDFFIITSANRVWIARTLLHLFKKLTYLLNRQHFYCMNYFVDETHSVIMEKNIYTATEVATIMPLRGVTVFEDFFSVNSWTKKFLPNNYLHISSAREIKRTWIRNATENILSNRAGNTLDTLLMKLTTKRWNSKSRRNKKNMKGLPMGLHTGKHFAKPDPGNFQKKLLLRYENALAEVLDQYELSSRVKNG